MTKRNSSNERERFGAHGFSSFLAPVALTRAARVGKGRNQAGIGLVSPRLAAAIAAAMLAGGVAAPSTYAGTVSLVGNTVRFEAGTGEANAVVVTGSAFDEEPLVIRDAGAPITAGSGCTSVDLHTASCRIAPEWIAASVVLADGNDSISFEDDYLIRVSAEGGDGNDRILGGGGASFELRGGEGNDVLVGGELDDILDGGPGADTLDGAGLGGPDDCDWDVVLYEDRTEAVVVRLNARADDGEAGENDHVKGVEEIRAGAGDDVLIGDSLANTLRGGDGNDLLRGGAGGDVLDGGHGADTVSGGTNRFEEEGCGSDIDVVDYSARAQNVSVSLNGRRDDGEARERDLIRSDLESIVGGSGDDLMVGDRRWNSFDGKAGNDVLRGRGGRDVLDGRTGNDRLDGGAGGDSLFAQAGRDRLFGGGGPDVLLAGRGNDRASGGSGADRIEGETGRDTITGGGGRDELKGSAGNDTFYARERIRDEVVGGRGRDRARIDRGLDARRGIEHLF